MEKWKDVPGYENYYQVSNFGKIKNIKSTLLKGSTGTSGYLHCTLVKNKIRKTVDFHRIVALNFVENPNNYGYVNHIDGNKLNNCSNNLEWCTARQNTQHATIMKLKNDLGENSTNSKLTTKNVLKIRKLSAIYTNAQLGEKFGVSKDYISLVIHKKRWSHL